MAKKFQLKDRSGEEVYPLTTTDCVIDGGGGYLTDTLAVKADKAELSNVVADEFVGGVEQVLGVTREELKKDLFIDMWNEACTFGTGVGNNRVFGKYNEETGYFELNGLTDITYEEAISIYICSNRSGAALNTSDWNYSINNAKSPWSHRCRTLFPIYCTNLFSLCTYSTNIEVIQLVNYYICNNSNDKHNYVMSIINTRTAFTQCKNLREIYPILQMPSSDNMSQHFYDSQGCKSLELVRLHGVRLPILSLFKTSTNLRIESLRYLVDNAANTTNITINVHADVFAKLTDPENTEWYQLNQDAIDKQITFAIP